VLEDHVAALQRLSDRWRKLEGRLKAAEQLSGTVTIPAINELRYSGRRFFEAWLIAIKQNPTEEDRQHFLEHILMAEQYFNNADHDLTDATIAFLSERREQILSKYGLYRWRLMYPTIKGWVDRLEEARDLIVESRSQREHRFDAYTKLETEYLPELVRRYKEIVLSETLYLTDYNRRKWWRGFERVVLLAAAVVGIITAISDSSNSVGSLFTRLWRHLW
jgi:hypothetical protein